MRLLAKSQKPVILIKKDGSRTRITMNIEKDKNSYFGLTQCKEVIERGDHIEQLLEGSISLYRVIDSNTGTGNIKRLEMEKSEMDNLKMDRVERINELVSLGERALKEDHRIPEPGIIMPDYISGGLYLNWLNKTQLFAIREMANHPFSERIIEICKNKNESISEAKELLSYLKSLLEDDVFVEDYQRKDDIKKTDNKKVFIVHGHDEAAINEVARTLEHDSFEPIILREQPDNGNTIIEKIEENSDVGYAVVLYTPCDEGRDANKKDAPLMKRARQNVVFEHGYLMGLLSRKKVVALVKGDIETPGDISGVVYIPLDEAGAWKMKLCKNLSAAGLDVNANNWL